MGGGNLYPLEILKNDKDYAYDNTKTLTTTTNTYDSKGNLSKEEQSIVIDSQNVTFNAEKTKVNSVVDRVQEGGLVLGMTNLEGTYLSGSSDYWATRTYTYNKNGQPTKIVYGYDNKAKTWNMTTDADGNITTSAATTTDGADSTLTSTFTYGSDLQLAKAVQEAVGTSEMTTAMLTETVWGAGGQSAATPSVSSRTYTTASSDLTKLVFTTTYDSHVKDGSIALTSSTASIKTAVNGTDNERYTTQGISYTLKKISVPSSRATAVMQETFASQWQDLAELPLGTIQTQLYYLSNN